MMAVQVVNSTKLKWLEKKVFHELGAKCVVLAAVIAASWDNLLLLNGWSHDYGSRTTYKYKLCLDWSLKIGHVSDLGRCTLGVNLVWWWLVVAFWLVCILFCLPYQRSFFSVNCVAHIFHSNLFWTNDVTVLCVSYEVYLKYFMGMSLRLEG